MEITRNELLVKKSNDFILSKYKCSSLLEAKILAISLTHIQMVGETPVAIVTTSEVKDLLGSKQDDRNIYGKMKTVGRNMTSQSIFIENNQKNEFVSFSLVTQAHYKNGTLKLTYNSLLAPYILNLKQNFTSYGIENIAALTSVYSVKLYEILKKEVFRIQGANSYASVEYSLSELRALLGLISMPEDQMEKMRNRGATWDEIEAAAKEVQMGDYSNFKRRVLERTKKELENHSDIKYTYDAKKAGLGGKIQSIVFHVYKNKKDEIPETLKSYIGHNNLTEAELLILFKEAEQEAERVVDAIRMADEAPNIENYVGWIRSCIRDDYKQKVETIHGSKETADKVKGILKDLQDAQDGDPNGEFFVNMWNKAAARPEMSKFMEQMSAAEREYFDLYDYKDKVENFLAWKREKNRVSI